MSTTHNPTVITLTGAAGSGKNTVADHMVAHALSRKVATPLDPNEIYIMAFADPLKEMLYRLNPIIGIYDGYPLEYQNVVDDIGYEVAKRKHPLIRTMMQRLGTDAVRKVLGDNTWIDHMEKRINNCSARLIIITDARFPNEVELMQKYGQIVRVERPTQDHNLTTKQQLHESERVNILPYDILIKNDGSLFDLTSKAIETLHAIDNNL